ncbi:HEPN domain-containing protein [Conexibacter arvalis]|uniref:HEPN domain-containing protein n=1 Tax=Conexibacter arvalis TaxID=912552 RepID=A0A840IIH1_9ACTN|nr:HEPN domain-containing protein [Conexibacter arvalis]MBB4664566.1 HEPN domain-containing protein [Conexibacter arvalis]
MAEQRDLARDLLALAEDDLLAARALSETADVSAAIVGFHTQQAVEKALKAVLALHGVEFPFTHDLEGLLELCSASAVGVPEHLADVGVLTPYGVRFRYGPIDPEDLVAPAAALALARDAVAWARTALGAG